MRSDEKWVVHPCCAILYLSAALNEIVHLLPAVVVVVTTDARQVPSLDDDSVVGGSSVLQVQTQTATSNS